MEMEPIRKQQKLPEQIADKLRTMIIQEQYSSGAKLPAESELMERFCVSRSTIREAVKILQTERIVDIRQGQGTFLCAMPGLAADPLGLRFANQQKLIEELLTTRLLIEPGVAALAAVSRTQEQIAAMKILLDKMDNAYLHGAEFTSFDSEFHSLIARCTDNEVIERLLPTIRESVPAGYYHTQYEPGVYQRTSRRHQDIYRAIAEGDSARAAAAASQHIVETMKGCGLAVPEVLLK